MNWKHEPESNDYSESWRLFETDGDESSRTLAMVTHEHGKIFQAHIYPSAGNHARVGDVYASAATAKGACIREMKRRGLAK